MKHRILSFCIPPGHRCTIIALEKGTEGCLEFTATATASIESFLAYGFTSSLPGCRLATRYLDDVGCFDEPSH